MNWFDTEAVVASYKAWMELMIDRMMLTAIAVWVVGYTAYSAVGWFYRRGYRRGRLEERIQVPDPYVKPVPKE